jgi:cytochrome oxidase Cu insertion factor (SCO1/SenC/PrrC family)
MPAIRPQRLTIKLLLAVMAALIFALSYYLGNRYGRPVMADLQAWTFPQPQRVVDFTLRDKDGKIFNQDNLRDHWNFLMTGNLEDPGCRKLLRLYVYAWNHLAHDLPLQEQTRVVFLQTTGMPRAVMKQAVEFYNPVFTAVSGDAKAMERITRQIGLPDAHLLPSSCSIEKSAVALINPDGFLVALFTGLTDPAVIAHDQQFFN